METHDSQERTEIGATPPSGLPYRWVGLALLGLLGVVLVGGLWLSRQVRPAVGLQPVTPAAPLVASAPAATVRGTSARPVTTPTAGTSSANSPQQEVEAAVQKYLQVYSDAVANLDTSHLAEALSGPALTLVTDEVNELKAAGRPGRIIEDDRTLIVTRVGTDAASVLDEYTSKSVYIDPKTGQPVPRSGPPVRVRQTYELRKLAGVWKIVDGTREELSP